MKNSKKVIFKIIQVLLIAFTVYIMLFTIITVRNVNRNSGNGIFGYKIFIVLSDSMKPKFQAGDMVVTKSIDPKELKEGDIITFYLSDAMQKTVTHQIHEKVIIDSKEAFITKGINVDQPDENPIYANHVIGKYTFSIPKAGYLFNFLKTPMGYVIFILCPFLIILTYNGTKFVLSIKEYKKEKQKETEDSNKLLEEERRKNEKMKEELNLLKKQLSSNLGNNGELG